jgi:hypothetical protein
VRRERRIQQRRSARCKMRGVRSNSVCGVAKLGLGRAGQAFELVEPGVMDGTTANSSPRTATGHNRMTRSSRQSPPQGTARGFWIRAWGQREPANQRTGRLNGPARRLDPFKDGLDIPATHTNCNSLHIEYPIRTLTRRASSRAGRVGTLRLVQLFSSCRKGAGRGSSPHRTRPWPQCRSRRG